MLRTWLAGALRAMAPAFVVPVALVAAVLTAGSLGGLSTVEQLLAGPEVPRALELAGDGDGDGAAPPRAAVDVPAIPRPAPRGGPSGTGRASSPGGGATAPAGGGAPAAPAPPSTRPGPSPSPAPRGTPPPAPAPSTPAPPAPAPAEPPAVPLPPDAGDVVRGTGRTVAEAVRPVPVVGEPAAQAVEGVVDAVAPRLLR